MLITEGTTADCTQASKLINGINAEPLVADKAYDTHTLDPSLQREEHQSDYSSEEKPQSSACFG